MLQSDKKAVGKLESVTKFTVHTFNAMTTVRGRKASEGKPKIYGLYDFSSRFVVIYRAAANGDPFAIYQLVQLEDVLTETDKIFNEQQQEIKSIVDGLPDSLEIGLPQSKSPEMFTLSLSSYGAMALRYIARLDQLVLGWRNLMHQNLVKPKYGHDKLNRLSSVMRTLMGNGAHYRFTGVNRTDLKERNARAIKALETLYQTTFLSEHIFPLKEDAATYFAEYSEVPEFGPIDMFEDGVLENNDSPALPDKSTKSDKSTKGPFKGKRDSGVATAEETLGDSSG